MQSRTTIRVALFTGNQRFTPRAACSRARSFEDRTLREPGSLDESPVLPCQAAISFPLTPRSVRATVLIPQHLLHATWLVPLVDRTWALSRNGQVTASLDYTSSAEPRLGTIVRQNRRHRRPWIFIRAYVPLLASSAASLFYGAATIGRVCLIHR